MPILGIFSKKQRAQGDASSSAGLYDGQNGSDFDSTLSSPTAEYVTADKTVPSSPNGRQALQVQVPDYSQPAPSRKLRIPFRRKKSFNAGSPSSIRTTNTVNFLSAPRPTHVPRNSTGAVSEVDISEFRRLEPPPPKSAVFSAYGDPRSALSTRSLPSDRRGSDPNSPPPPLPTPSKRPSFFNWNKSSTNVIPKSPGFSLKRTKSRTEPPPDSFNLKSFRHISPSSPEPPPAVIPPSNPRPRGASGASEASQRISVAAFREAQAKRSLAGSPGPSSRAPSPHGGIPPLPTGRGSPAMRGKASASRSPPVTRNRPLKAGRMSSALDTSDSDEDESSEEEDSDERDGLSRRRTVTHRKTSSMGGDEKPANCQV
ncbi:hypothetical protein C8J56DRAFT_85567 [Mycena floridula]|nr:hypothetical protein C8J56DRAFT_85567 [Mycena floridula]